MAIGTSATARAKKLDDAEKKERSRRDALEKRLWHSRVSVFDIPANHICIGQEMGVGLQQASPGNVSSIGSLLFYTPDRAETHH